MSWKQTKNSDFSDVIYITSKNEFKIMWLSQNTKAMDSFLPQKWEVHTCSIWSGYSVFGFLVNATSKNNIPTIEGKRIMDRTQSHASITSCVWTAAHAFISSRNRLGLMELEMNCNSIQDGGQKDSYLPAFSL